MCGKGTRLGVTAVIITNATGIWGVVVYEVYIGGIPGPKNSGK